MLDTLLIKIFLQPYWRLTRSQTLGVQGIVVGEPARILLVRHSYVRGWHLPGGGVQRNENLEEALRRELKEETGISLLEKPQLHGIFSNFGRSPGDHIAVFIIRRWEASTPARAGLEIIENKFFDLHELPLTLIDGARRRLDEVFAGRAISNSW